MLVDTQCDTSLEVRAHVAKTILRGLKRAELANELTVVAGLAASTFTGLGASVDLVQDNFNLENGSQMTQGVDATPLQSSLQSCEPV